ncbi:nectin-4 [Acanthochromis polyacanthus]|uniref:nectin-4 n=1 Tax=Acanthochromis polyacanthus TaxID=80966 RepID=UPI00223443CC|nr:nectin-4 [Acanthochromis polyacanthus]
MTSLLSRLSLCLCVLRIFVIHAEFVQPSPNEALRSLAEEETVLPCVYRPNVSDTVVQVTWYKEKPDTTREQIILAHHLEGYTAFGTWSQRVRFQSSVPTLDSSLVIMNTEVSDGGKYICHVNTFPKGNFDREMSLTVWTVPISSLDPVILVEGQSYRQAATCRAIAHPPPRLTWDSDLNGQSLNRSLDNGAVSSQYSLHPLRNMNGKKLDCLVWHPAFSQPRRIRNNLVVHFPPYAEVSGFNKDWFVGMRNAALRCVSGGNPKPDSFTWIRMNGELPNDAIIHPNGTLIFGRPLNMSDGGTYQCVATNEVGEGKAEVDIIVAEPQEEPEDLESLLMIIVGGVAGGMLILMLVIVITVTCHHKRKNKRLKRELTQKKEEISTLTRQASFRRVNSLSTDARGTTEENIPLRVEGTLRTSLSSLGEQTHCRDSRSTISGGRGGGGISGAYDYLGRPVLYNNSRRGRERTLDRDEENRLRVETYVKSTISLQQQETQFHPPLTPSSFPMVQSTEIVRQLNGGTIIPSDGGSRPGSVAKNHQSHPAVSCTYPPVTDDEDEVDEGLGGPASQEHPDDQDSETNSSHSTRYHQTNGALRSLTRKSPPLVNPHTSLIHKAQIV